LKAEKSGKDPERRVEAPQRHPAMNVSPRPIPSALRCHRAFASQGTAVHCFRLESNLRTCSSRTCRDDLAATVWTSHADAWNANSSSAEPNGAAHPPRIGIRGIQRIPPLLYAPQKLGISGSPSLCLLTNRSLHKTPSQNWVVLCWRVANKILTFFNGWWIPEKTWEPFCLTR